jgi:hypothetical protein
MRLSMHRTCDSCCAYRKVDPSLIRISRPRDVAAVGVERSFDDDRLRRRDDGAKRFVGEFGDVTAGAGDRDVEAARGLHRVTMVVPSPRRNVAVMSAGCSPGFATSRYVCA